MFQGGYVQGSGGPVRSPARMQVWRRLALWMALGPALAGVIFIFVYFGLRPSAGLSSYVQAHGVQRTAVIQSVDNVPYTHGSNPLYTADILVRLTAPVGGQSQVVIHYPGYESDRPGDTLTVLVDPEDPGYAELPGLPNNGSTTPLVFLIIGSVLLVLAIALGVFGIQGLRRPRPTTVIPTWQRGRTWN